MLTIKQIRYIFVALSNQFSDMLIGVLLLLLLLLTFAVINNVRKVKYSQQKIAKLSSDVKKNQSEIKQLIERNNHLTAYNLSLEANQLKFLLQPHTLNNILANLKVFSNKLNKGMDSLSETLEYIFYKGDDHFVTIEDEINFIVKYLELNDLFLQEIDSIHIYDDTDENSEYFRKECIPHLITAYFLENAFKHGDPKNAEFLKVYLFSDHKKFEISVVNKIRKHTRLTKGGLGLKNMKRRLTLLVDGKYDIKNSCNEDEYHATLTIYF